MELIQTPDNPAPSGAQVATIRTQDGLDLRVARWHPWGEAQGTVVVCQGRAEFIEKYFETIEALLARKLCVVAFDWRGQGLSGRELANRRKGHIDDFSIYERDLEAIMQQIVAPFCPQPWFGLAHSMGGAILLGQARRGNSPFARIVTTAPMIDLYGLRFPMLARVTAEVLDAVGLGSAFIPGGSSRARLMHAFYDNVLTRDERRFKRCADILRADERLILGDPTIGWVNAAFRVMRDFADPEFPRRVMVPCLVFNAGADRVVDGRAIERFAQRLKAGRVITLPSAEHEILQERDDVLAQFWAGFDAFVPGSLVANDAALMR
jgi:lysophospholipase